MVKPFHGTLLGLTPDDLATLVRAAVADALRESGLATPKAEATKTVFTTSEFAAWLGVSPRSVGRLVAREHVPYRKVGKQFRFVRAELEAWLATRGGAKGEPEDMGEMTLATTVDARTAARVASIARRQARKSR